MIAALVQLCRRVLEVINMYNDRVDFAMLNVSNADP